MTTHSKKPFGSYPTSKPTAKIRVLVADDHVTVLEGLTAIVGRQRDMVVVGEASDGRQAVDYWAAHRPDVTLMDLSMPHLSGVEAIKSIRAINSEARVIVLTTYDTDADILNAIKAGAKAYLLKDSRREEILDCIRNVHRGETCIPAAIIKKLAIGLSREELTQRESDVLALLAIGKSNKEISTALCISETTVKSHLGSVFRKLDVLSRTEAIAAACRRGLIKI